MSGRGRFKGKKQNHVNKKEILKSKRERERERERELEGDKKKVTYKGERRREIGKDNKNPGRE